MTPEKEASFVSIDGISNLNFSRRRQTVISNLDRERSGSVVECLTRDREAGGSSLTVTGLWSLSKTHLS